MIAREIEDGDKMSKIFKISGNYMQDGEWMEPNPAFVGEIVVDETGKFCGWCEELYGRYKDNDALISGRIRYLVGAIARESNGYSLLFFKLSNCKSLAPLLYEIHSDIHADCYWAAMGFFGGFAAQGNARVTLEELPYSEERADQIKLRFDNLDEEISENSALIQEVSSWQQKTLVLWV